ncbi:MAG: DUF4870 domain-containing protein [Acidobacteriota bacterium]
MSFDMQYRPQMALQTADEKQMALFLHLSQLANVIFFPLGILAPILIWQLNKDKMPALDPHGKMVVNWMISTIIYGFVSILLIFVFLIGLIPLIGLMIAGIAFPIIGAIKANNDGDLWEYPLTIKFLK